MTTRKQLLDGMAQMRGALVEAKTTTEAAQPIGRDTGRQRRGSGSENQTPSNTQTWRGHKGTGKKTAGSGTTQVRRVLQRWRLSVTNLPEWQVPPVSYHEDLKQGC